MKRTILAAVLLAGTALAVVPAKADTFVTLGGVQWNTTNSGSLSLTAVVPSGNQPQNIQCVICGDNQPQQQADFGYNDFKNSGNLTNVSAFSDGTAGGVTLNDNTIGTGYSGNFLRNYLLTHGDPLLTFSIGVDINDNGTAQTLNSFFFLNLTQHTVLASFTDGTTGNVPAINNGTGFPDYTITGFDPSIRAGIAAGDQLMFFARMTGMNDGPDSFFLTPNVAAVPGPIVGAGIPGLVAACAALWGLGWRRRRRLVS
jgi:hypothetical protein